MLESLKHGDSSFITLTYSPENIPEGGTLVPKHAQDWLKRLRRQSTNKLRYYLVGEYGDHTQRPHYHAAIFGIGPESRALIESTWGKGHVHVGDLTKDSSAYVAGYVTKKMTSPTDPRLKGRHPEFARMSLRPGIGATAMHEIANVLTSKHGAEIIINNKDVPNELSHGGKTHPLGRYLKRILRETLGFYETGGQTETINQYKQEMFGLLQEALAGEKISNPALKREALKAFLLDQNKQKVLNLETKQRIFAKKGSL